MSLDPRRSGDRASRHASHAVGLRWNVGAFLPVARSARGGRMSRTCPTRHVLHTATTLAIPIPISHHNLLHVDVHLFIFRAWLLVQRYMRDQAGKDAAVHATSRGINIPRRPTRYISADIDSVGYGFRREVTSPAVRGLYTGRLHFSLLQTRVKAERASRSIARRRHRPTSVGTPGDTLVPTATWA